MPSLRMNKSNTCCLIEKNSLRVCKNSTVISKKSCSHLKISQLVTEAGPCCQSSKDVSPSNELNIHDAEIVEVKNSVELLCGEDIQSKQLPTSSIDCAVVEGMDLPTVSCSSSMETIFSPNICHIDVRDQNVPNTYDNTGVNNDQFYLNSVGENDGNSGSSSDHQTCNISDFYISDMVLAGLPFDGSPVCDNIAETLMFSDYDAAMCNILFDDSDQQMTLPFLDDLAKSSETLNELPSEEARVDFDSSSFMLAIHQINPGDEADIRPFADSDESQYFDPHSFIRNLPDLSDVPSGQPAILPKESQQKKPITLALDLDETLVHSTLEHCEDADFTFTVFFNMKEHSVYVRERPHLRTFLQKVAAKFEVVVFTASQSIYAARLLDILDPDGKLISGRAYRESCILLDGTYTKDLTVLGVDLAKIAIIDNSPQVFRLQVNNGIPIKSWFDDPSDNELISLIPFLETLADADDVRPLIAKTFGNKD